MIDYPSCCVLEMIFRETVPGRSLAYLSWRCCFWEGASDGTWSSEKRKRSVRFHSHVRLSLPRLSSSGGCSTRHFNGHRFRAQCVPTPLVENNMATPSRSSLRQDVTNDLPAFKDSRWDRLSLNYTTFRLILHACDVPGFLFFLREIF